MKTDEPEVTDELVLVKRARSGDQDAFHRLFASYEPRLLWYLTNMLGDSENARDVLQETFIAAFRAGNLPTSLVKIRARPVQQSNQGMLKPTRLHPGYIASQPIAP